MPSQWKYLPRTLDICALDPFAKVLDAKSDVAVTAADFEDAFRQLPEILLASSDAHKIHDYVACSKSRRQRTSPLPAHREQEK
jgi:hypothetical protein